ncbi:MAG TPA: c-type cytochrome [Jatrophihabitantaceae bacterium]|jgi:ubiquinol-cytochrome c reductase cytochrome c subunit|nr:c-type cytochrome [Jatrophihabitantaceae bacterium]
MSTDRATERTNVADEEGADFAAELGFEPAVSVTGSDGAATPSAARRPLHRSALRRRLSAVAILAGALASMGGAYAAFASSSGAADSTDTAASIAHGKQLYEVSCITCHGQNLEGVQDQGPALVGVGGAAVYFQVSTGRMPATGQSAYIPRKTAKFDEQETEDLAAYVQSIGGGPTIPAGSLKGDSASIAEGGELFRQNCASCHGTTFKGAPLPGGQQAPSLNDSSDKVIFGAMISGPESMPVFSNNELTLSQKKAIIAYIQTIKASNDPGGSGIDRIGPVSEAIVAWVGGVGLLMIVILWIGAKSQ